VKGFAPDEWKKDAFGNKVYPPPLPIMFRTGELLVFVGEEMTAPPGYLQRLQKCYQAWQKLMEPIIARHLTAVSPGESPFPDPTIDVSVRGYAERLNRLMRTL
ncbi:MAG TPA: hypothetical protein VLQ67_03250, partial [Arachnia sp.]|nr:hypothetical protein [Arachnia sp.]